MLLQADRVSGRKASQFDLRLGSEFLVLFYHLLQPFVTDYVHRRLTTLSVHEAGELFQRLNVPVLTELHGCLVKSTVLLQLLQDLTVSLPSKAQVQSSWLNTYNPNQWHSGHPPGILRAQRGWVGDNVFKSRIDEYSPLDGVSLAENTSTWNTKRHWTMPFEVYNRKSEIGLIK